MARRAAERTVEWGLLLLQGATVLFALLLLGFAAIFLRPGLLDWGAYEN